MIKKYTIQLGLLLLLSAVATAQTTLRDGNMKVDFRFEKYYFESGDDIWPDKDEFNWQMRVQDESDVDGVGWWYTGNRDFDNGIFTTGPYFLDIPGNIFKNYTYGSPNTLGPNPTPAGFRFGFEGWEDDCPGSCTGFCGFFGPCTPLQGSRTTYEANCIAPCFTCPCFAGGDDQYVNNEMTAGNFISHRFGVPNQYNFYGLTRTGDVGYNGGNSGNNVGVQFSVAWTPPCADTLYADNIRLCDPGYVTLFTGGAAFGGSYRFYRMVGGVPIFQQETQDSFWTTYIQATSTFRVFTKNPVSAYNPTGESWSYREITIVVGKPNVQAITTINPSCYGTNTGSITVTASGGIGTLNYSKDNGITYQTSNVFSNLGQGLYLIKIKDNFCEVPDFGATIQLSDPPLLDAYLESVSQVLCNGQNTGSINLTSAGGTPGYTFNWTKNGVPYATTEDLTQLGAGNYRVTVTDTKGCTDTVSATISQPTAPLAVVGVKTNVSCHGANDGSVDLTITGGTMPYNIFWSNGFTGEDPTGLPAGIYTVNITDFNNCTANAVFTITSPASMTLLFDTVKNVLCYGGNTGVISTLVSGGNGTYNYAWSPAIFSGSDIHHATAGWYALTVTDGNGCSVTGNVSITQPDTLQIGLENLENQDCYGDSSGAVMISVSGGVPTYLFAWSNGSTNEDISNLAGGNYQVTVTDKNACTATASYTVTGPSLALSAFISTLDVQCFGGRDGKAIAVANGGTPPYHYFWSDGDTSSINDSLPAGFYTITVTDNNGCQIGAQAPIGQPSIISVLDTIKNLKCFGDANGFIHIGTTGATPPYNYFWSNNSTSQNLDNITADNYTLTVRDANGCTFTKNYSVTQPSALVSSVAGNNPDCHGNATGFAVVSIAGGVPPYSYQWNTTPVQTGIMAIKLAGNMTYRVHITDGNNCLHTDSVSLMEPTKVSVSTVPSSVSCFSGNDGQVTIDATGGNPGYQYYLNGVYNGTNNTFTGLTAGNYIAVAEDINKCAGSALFSIAQPSQIKLDAGKDVIALAQAPVQLNATASSIYGIKSFDWNYAPELSCLNCANPIATCDSTIDFVVRVTDSTNCIEFDTVRVTIKRDFLYFIPTAFTPNGDNLNDYFEVNVMGAKKIEMKIFNRWGEEIYSNDNMPNGVIGQPCTTCWDGTWRGNPVQFDTYTYQISVLLYGEDNPRKLVGTVAVMR